MWRETGLLGRDDLLKKKIRPRLLAGKGFVLTGQHGIGKTAILEWAHENTEGMKAYVSASWTTKDILKEICSSWGLDVLNNNGEIAAKSSWQIKWMEQAILSKQGYWVFVDDIQNMKPATLLVFRAMRDRFIIAATAVPPIKKEELKRMLWGLTYIQVKALKNSDMERLGKLAAPIIKTTTPVGEAVHASRGIPAHLFHALRGEVTPESAKSSSEEIDISPVLLIGLAGIMVLRYVGRGLDSTSMTLLGGLGMAGAVIFRFYLFKGMGK